MERRLVPLAALFIVLSVAGVALGAAAAPGASPLAAVGWPTSTLLISELQTGGASASDEFAEITNVESQREKLIRQTEVIVEDADRANAEVLRMRDHKAKARYGTTR